MLARQRCRDVVAVSLPVFDGVGRRHPVAAAIEDQARQQTRLLCPGRQRALAAVGSKLFLDDLPKLRIDDWLMLAGVGFTELINEAFAIRNQLLSGSDDSIEAMSAPIGVNEFRLTSLVRLSYLSPGIIRAFLAGRHPTELTPTRLLRLSKDLPHDWQEQRHFLGLAGAGMPREDDKVLVDDRGRPEAESLDQFF
jgi:hypothetical protein